MYRDRLAEILERFETRYHRDLVAQFKSLQRAGIFEIVTSSATHAFLPCFDAASARAQIQVGVECYRRHFGHSPPGIWLPECGFVPGLDRILADQSLSYFFVDSHAVEFADPMPILGTYAPIVCPSGAYAFARNRDSSAQVWSADWGYPGDGRYREFYRDIGFDLDEASLRQFIPSDGNRRSTGIKYHRVTARDIPLHGKEPYHRGWAMEAVEQHAEHFVRSRNAQMQCWHDLTGRQPVVVAPYDAELFGHWWFEGPEFLDRVVRKIADGCLPLRLSTPTDVIDSGVTFQVAMPAASSWGAYGYSDTWVNARTQWIWPHLLHAVDQMATVARDWRAPSELEIRALNQLGREVLLACSSDWPFMITMGTMVGYAERRIRAHVNRFSRLLEQLKTGQISESWLRVLEETDNVFLDLDYRVFAAEAT